MMTVGGDAMRVAALTDCLGYMGRLMAGSCDCGSAKWWRWQQRMGTGMICACHLGSLQGQAVGVADCCERALGLLRKEKT